MKYRYLARDWEHPEWAAAYVAFTHLPMVGLYADTVFEWCLREGHSKCLDDETGEALVGPLPFGGIVRLPHGLKTKGGVR